MKDGNICVYDPPTDNSGCCLGHSQETGKCVECASGLSLFDGECKEIKIIGCLQKTLSGSCINCAVGYTLYGGRCLRTIEGCEKYHATGECDTCKRRFELYDGVCLPIDIEYISCLPPFVELSNGECSLPGCKTTYEFGCAECLPGHKLLPTGTCHSDEIIVGC